MAFKALAVEKPVMPADTAALTVRNSGDFHVPGLLALLLAINLAAPAAVEAKSRAMKPAERVALSLPSGKVLAASAVRDAIVSGAAVRGWRVQAETPGIVTLRNVIRGKHTVVVAVAYDSAGMQVNYVSSENLNYKQRSGKTYIHPKYQEWVDTMILEILAKIDQL